MNFKQYYANLAEKMKDGVQSSVIACDVTLFIRLLEIAREEIKSDAELHQLVERCSEQAAAKGKPLTMDDYRAIRPYKYFFSLP